LRKRIKMKLQGIFKPGTEETKPDNFNRNERTLRSRSSLATAVTKLEKCDKSKMMQPQKSNLIGKENKLVKTWTQIINNRKKVEKYPKTIKVSTSSQECSM